MIRSAIRDLIQKAVQDKYGSIRAPDFSIEVPENPEHGDYATNAALVLAKALKKPPMEVAKALVNQLPVTPPRMGEARPTKLGGSYRVQAAPPGFINFWLAPDILTGELAEILKEKQQYGRDNLSRLNLDRMVRINVEFISANPTGPLTIGNGRGAFLGDALANVLSFYGRRVTREYYINDARASTQIQELGKAILKKGEAYKSAYTEEIRRRLKEKYFSLDKMSEDDVGYLAAQEIQKDNRRAIEKILKIKFDIWYSEERLYKNRLVRGALGALNKKGVMYEKDGALWFRASKFGDSEDRVALRTGGAPTYFLPDVAYHAEKLMKRKFDGVVDILGADHFGTFPRVLAGLRVLELDANRVTAIFTQMARIVRGGKEVKISKRKGTYVTLEELVKEVGLDAARWFFLEKSPDTHMDFDLDLAKERSIKNPVYYVQYAFVRCRSILRKAQSTKSKAQIKHRTQNTNLLNTPEEQTLIKKLVQFPEVVEDTAKDYQVHRLTRYAYELAREFHNFYEKHRVITEDKELTQARLSLVKAAQIVLQQVLGLLGISAPKRM